MKILILGASRGTGALAASLAIEHGHDVTAFARNPQKLEAVHPKLTKRKGDFHDPESVDAAVAGHDAVLITASVANLADFKDNPTYFSKGTGYAIEAMKKHGVRRLVVLSALGTGESRKLLNPVVGLVVSFLLKAPLADHERQEELVMVSDLEWVIARPGRLTGGPARKKYVVKTGTDRVPRSISRADLADFLVKAAETDTWVRRAVQLGG